MMMKQKKRIGILGTGGVGGYLGALLAWKYAGSGEVEIIFLTRGKSAELIDRKGILLKTDAGEILAHPQMVCPDPAGAGILDVLLVCTKTYDLEEGIAACRNSLTPSTLILPLLNGIDAPEVIRSLIPGANVLEGCIYLISAVESPGIIRQRGSIRSVHFGSALVAPEELQALETLMTAAGIDAHYEREISRVTWTKFVFISVVASATSYFNRSVDNILDDAAKKKILLALLDEIILVAAAKGLQLTTDIRETTLGVMKKLPQGTTSSMQRDFQHKKKTEVEALTGSVVRMAAQLNVNVPAYTKVYRKLKN